MDHLRVFLSHTSDLDTPSDPSRNFVGAAIRTIAALPGFSVEEQTTTFAAEDGTPAEVCRRRLAACNIYVGIIGYAPGTPVGGDSANRSFVEFEFDVAREFCLPRILLVWNAPGKARDNVAQSQSSFRARLGETQEIVFAPFTNVGDLRLALENALAAFQPRESEHVSCHVEWAAPAELASIGVPPYERRWGVYARNGSPYPAYNLMVRVHSNNGGKDYEIDMGTLPARDVTSTPYILNEERDSFDPEGDRPVTEMSFTVAGIRWRRRADGSLVRVPRASSKDLKGR